MDCRLAGLDVTEEFKGGASVPIGRPIDNTACYIVDSALQLLPMGVPGELVVSGVQACDAPPPLQASLQVFKLLVSFTAWSQHGSAEPVMRHVWCACDTCCGLTHGEQIVAESRSDY